MIAPAIALPPRWAARRFARVVPAQLALLCLMALTIACDKSPLTAPTGSEVTLFSNTTIVPVNGTAQITATVVESGGTLVQNGTLVTFTTTIGTLDPGEARTRDGKVTVRLVAGGRSGRAVVRAFSGGVSSGDLTLDIGGAAAGRISLSANPSNVPVTGGTSTLLAVVFDVDGNRLPGAPVSFTTNAGSIAQSVVVTNADGEARTTITTNRETTVTARAGGAGATGGEGGAGATAAVEATVTISASGLPTAGVSTSTTSPTEGQAVVFSVTAGASTPAAVRNVSIDFGDGTSQPLGAVSSTTSVAHIYARAGTYTVTVTVEDTNGARVSASTVVVVVQAAPLLVSLTVTPQTTTPGAIVTFTARVDQNPNNIAVQSVSFQFGDGNSRPAQASLSTSHIYGIPGNFLAVATVRFVNGDTAQGTAAVAVRAQ